MKVSSVNFLQVDVNGQEIFMVDKDVLAKFSSRIENLFSRVDDNVKHLKVIFHEFPGGANGFELMLRFCYNNGVIKITPFNVVLLNLAANFMKMGCLLEQTESFFDGIEYWTWSELLIALKQCQDTGLLFGSSGVLEKVLDCLIGRVVSPTVSSPFACFSESSSIQLSCDASSLCSLPNSCGYSTTWWFQDLLFMDVDLFDKALRMMVSNVLDHTVVFKFVLFYLKSRVYKVKLDEKVKITEAVIDLLSLLDKSSVSCKGLFDVLRIVSRLKTVRQCHVLALERLIGSRLDQATVDHLLLPSPQKKQHIYDVDLVLRLLRSFFDQCIMTPSKLKRLASLIDSYVIEVAPDLLLQPNVFVMLVLALPDLARDCCDRLYKAIDIYLEVHSQLNEEERVRICCSVNHEKLSPEVQKHLSKNSKFPSKTLIGKLVSWHNKADGSSLDESRNAETISNPPHFSTSAAQLEKVCRVMQRKISDATTPTRLCSQGVVRSLPKLCS